MNTLPDPARKATHHEEASAEDLPEAVIGKNKWALSAIWVVPLVAILVVGYLLVSHLINYGPLITIQFEDGSGIRAEQTDIEYRGVSIGQVKRVELTKDHRHVLVIARLQRSAETIASQGTQFWVVRLQGGLESFAHVGEAVGTVFSGAYIDVLPGTGPPGKYFIGLDTPPAVEQQGALHIVLRAANVGSLRPGVPILYKGVEVGAVQDFKFTPKFTAVEIQAVIKPEYAKLVRANSHFRNVTGGHMRFGLFKGLHIDVQSLRSLLYGGIEFSSPSESKSKPATDGMEFLLG
jgi:paraquat-inducible protein B